MSINQSSSSGNFATTEYIVRVPKADKKRYNVMKFNSSNRMEFAKWTQAKMERDVGTKEAKAEGEMPKFGAGSEYGREQKEEARRKKYGIASKKYNPDDQPWILRVGGKSGKRYRGIREGGISQNASYYVFTQAPDGAFEAFPIEEWYYFTPIQTYKTLNAEEAEEEFGRRDKVNNYFSIMVKKRLKNEEITEGEKEAGKQKDKKPFSDQGTFKISDNDEWMDSSNDDDDDEEEEAGKDKSDNEKGTKKGKKKLTAAKKKKKKKKSDSDEEAWEESDDGDIEGLEVDYISDESSGSEEEPDAKGKDEELKGVEDEEAIRKMENSESSEEEEENKDADKDAKKEEANGANKDKTTVKEKKEKKEASSSESGSDTSESDDFDNDSSFQSAMFMQDRIKGNVSKKSQKSKQHQHHQQQEETPVASRSNTPTKTDKSTGLKRSAQDEPDSKGTAAKRVKIENGSGSSISSKEMLIVSDEAVRRYLMRKPMTTTELLQKFKTKKTGISREKLVTTITVILKRLNPQRQTIKGKMYLSMKPN